MTSRSTHTKEFHLFFLLMLLGYIPCTLHARDTKSPRTPINVQHSKDAPIAHALRGSTAATELAATHKAEGDETEEATVEKTIGSRVAGFFISARRVYTDMPFAELKQAREAQRGSLDTFIKYTERLIALCDDIDEQSTLSLELAEALFATEKYERAGTQYAQFSKYYPGHLKTEYAHYQAIVCAQKRILDFDRDQTKTHETIDLTDTFLERKIFTTYRDKVEEVKSSCYKRLIESELNVCSFYLKKNRFDAVKQRVTGIHSNMIIHAPDMKATVVSFEDTIKKNQDAFNLAQKELVEKQAADAAKRYEKLTQKKRKKEKKGDTPAVEDTLNVTQDEPKQEEATTTTVASTAPEEDTKHFAQRF